MKTVLTIAGSDCSGGAGIQADIKTITMHGLYAMSAITALTAQNTTGVYGILDSTPEFLAQQLDCIFTDIYPDAVKIGMVSDAGLIRAIAEKLREYKAKNVVLDPVMVSTSGFKLLKDEAAEALMKELMPLADVVTPNIPEAEVLGGMDIEDSKDMEHAAAEIAKNYGGAVLVKGGHGTSTANDFLWENGKGVWFCGDRIESSNTHGTGCTLSSAIASNLAKGETLKEAVKQAKNYLTDALGAGLDLGKGAGPLEHNFALAGDNR
ncbi:MAG: bifunctional hydroxymethylpyrimidine kinase/phosphomethylpyrimidine kinase [Roseburia sp.]|nr:bifunctional hydroxymethylpyrimidine kinase/phosphomethylpyrimidine kinase [Roseburia sp.]